MADAWNAFDVAATAKDFTKGRNPDITTEDTLAGYLYTAPENDVDLLIRPVRTNWSTISVTDVYRFVYRPVLALTQKVTLIETILSFQGRERRFGGLKQGR